METTMTVPAIKRKVRVDEKTLLQRVGRAKELSLREKISHPKYSAQIWDAHLRNLLLIQNNFVRLESERKKLLEIKREMLPRAQKILARMRHVFFGNMGVQHPEVKITLATHLKGRTGSKLEHIKVLWNYYLNHKNLLCFSESLLSENIPDLILNLEKYDSNIFVVKKNNAKKINNDKNLLENKIWTDLKQLVSWSRAEFEPDDPRIAEFEDLISKKKKT